MACQKHLSKASHGAALGTPHAAASDAPRPAIFLDRDGTLIQEREYLSDPADLVLIPGTAAALLALREAGYALVCVTNQSAIGRGWLSKETLAEIHQKLENELATEGAWLDAIYFCPDVDGNGDSASITERDRKPGAGMLLHAARELNLDLAQSWIIGDHIRDLEAGLNAGCRPGILVLTGHGEQFRQSAAEDVVITRDIQEAAHHILEVTKR